MLDHDATSEHPDRIGSTHLVQLFDSDESLADAVADFFAEGLVHRDTMLAVMGGERWNAVAVRLATRGLLVDEALRFGQLIMRDTEKTLQKFMRRDRPDPGLFAASVGHLVTGLAANGRPLRIYGEMVDVLAAQGNFAGALDLEGLWNELGRRVEFRLYCGYTAAHFGDPRSASALRRICACHGEVLSSPRDVLGSFLLRTQGTG